MKKVLFVIPQLSHGGTNKCLESLLPFISNENEIHVVSLEKDGIYKKIFFDKLTFLSEYCYFISKSLLLRIIKKVFPKIGKKILYYLYKKEVIKIHKSINPDLVVAYQEGRATLFASLFPTYKIAWVHCDYKLYRQTVTNENEYNIYNKYNNIICVSESTLKSFLTFYPKLKFKSNFIYNIIDDKNIQNKAHEIILDSRFKIDEDTFVILSIGTYYHVKQFEKIPLIVNDILNKGINKNICWYIIGDGDKKLISYTKKLINKYNLENNVVLLGAKTNPYPYIKGSNLVVSLSKSEAYPNVINEGKVLHIPVLSTNYPSAVELIQNEYNGFIKEIKDFPDTIVDLINNRDNVYDNIKNNINDFNYDNDNIIIKINKLLEI